MPSYIIQIDRDDYQKIEEEEKNRFIKNVLSEIGIPFEDIWPTDNITTEQKIKLRKLLNDFDLDILDEDRGISIYHDKQLIARLNKPKYVIKTDPKAIKPSQKKFFEVTFDYWTMFEDIGEE